MMATPAHAGRGRHHQLVRHPRQPRLHLHPRRGAPRDPPRPGRGRRGVRRRPPRQGHPRLRLRPRRRRPRRRRRLHLRRGDRPARGLEGRRGQPRLRPPFPAVAGLYACPTVINNVESIASVPSIVAHGAEWFASMGTEKSKGYGIFSPLRPREPPGPVRSPARHHAARADRPRRRHARRPRAEVLDAGRLEHPAAHRRAPRHPPRLRGRRRGAARCSAPARCSSSTRPPASCAPSCAGPSSTSTSRAASARRAARARGGWCRPWPRSSGARAREADLDLLLDQCDNILGRSFCALGDGATSPISSSIQYFRDEYLAHLTHGGCPFDAARVDRVRRSPDGSDA